VKEDELTPFHKDALVSAGGMTTPDIKGSIVGGWTIKGSGNCQLNICQQLTPKGIGNMLGIRNPTPPNSDSNSGSTGSDKSNRFAVLQWDCILQGRGFYQGRIRVRSSFNSKANNLSKDTEGEFRVSDPTKIDKLVVPLDTTDRHSNDKLECNVSRVVASKPKKNRKSKYGPNKIHASKHAIKWSKRGTLVDQGANGGIPGNDAKVIFKRNKTVDVTGIDNHELNALPMVDATAKTIADKGPVILILRNYAYHGLNPTLHSAGQIKWYQNKAYDTSMKVGGRQVIKTVDGYYIPINII